MTKHELSRWRMVGIGLALAGLLIAAGGSRWSVTAQDATPAAASAALGPATVSVSGHGEVSVPPDTAAITVGVDVIQPTLDEAQREATAQATAVIAALTEAGIAEDDIQTAYYSVNILRDYSENADPTVITGFEISNQLQVTVHDTEALGTLLETVVAAGANSIYGVSFYVEDQTAAASEARVEAVEDARVKAAELAAAAGMDLGAVIFISEGVPAVPPPMVFEAPMADAAMPAPAPPPIETGSTIVTADVQMLFELR